MKKVSKFIALLLAALMLMTSFAFAATGSKEEPAKPKTAKQSNKKATYQTYKTGKATLIGTRNSAKKKTYSVPKTVTFKKYKYTVNGIGKNAFKALKKAKTIKFLNTKSYKVAKGAFGKLNTKKMTIKVTKKMSKAQFKKFKKNLKKASFKGTIKRA